ncbi:MAG: hypothetical protein KBE09_02250 [Candidatus Pacebacteria bacterium]|nr:hypothetical protein [Candidatus Paceibacterota bacterium]
MHRYPILALPGTDLSRYGTAIESLAAQNKKMASFYDEPEHAALEKQLLPVAFLATLSDLEEARRSLIDNPTVWRAATYATLLNTSLRQLETHLRSLSQTLTQYPQPGNIAFIDGTTDTETLARELGRMSVSVRTARHRALTQLSCIFLDNSLCNVSWEASARSATMPVTDAEIAAVQPLLSVINRTQAALSNYAPSEQKLIHAESRCATEPTVLTLPWYRTDAFGNKIRAHEPLSDILVIDYTKISHASGALEDSSAAQQRRRGVSPRMHEWFLNEGVTYLYQPMGGLYYCLQGGFDTATQARVLALYDELQINPLNPAPHETALERYSELQHTFLNDHVIEESTAEVLMQEVGKLLDEKKLSPEANLYLKNLVLVWHAQTYHFDETLRALYEHNLFTIAALEKNDRFPVATLLSMRSYPTLTFFMANENLYPTPPTLLTSPQRFATERFGIRTFSDLEKEIGTEPLTDALVDGFLVMSRLLEETRSEMGEHK